MIKVFVFWLQTVNRRTSQLELVKRLERTHTHTQSFNDSCLVCGVVFRSPGIRAEEPEPRTWSSFWQVQVSSVLSTSRTIRTITYLHVNLVPKYFEDVKKPDLLMITIT